MYVAPGVRFDICLYQKIRKRRAGLGLPVADLKREVPDHPLKGKTVTFKGWTFVVEGVYGVWHVGWYMEALLRDTDTGVRRTAIVSNITSGDVETQARAVPLKIVHEVAQPQERHEACQLYT
jgi:hypothetical protein